MGVLPARRTCGGAETRTTSSRARFVGPVVGAAAAAALTLLLAWLVAEHPTLGGVVAALCVVLLAVAVVQVLRDESPVLRAGAVALALVAGALAIVLTDGPSDDVATAAPGDGGTTVALASDPVDCDCARSAEVVGVGVDTSGGRSTIAVEFAAAPEDGAEVFVWRVAAPVGPLHLRRVDGTWRTVTDPWDASPATTEAGRGLTIRAAVDDPIAIVSGSGDRAPDVGHVASDGVTVASGAHAEFVERAVATVESGFARLDPGQQALAASLLSRQVGAGTVRYRATAPGSATPIEITLTVEYPQLSQVPAPAGTAVYALADQILSCTSDPGGTPTCRPAQIDVPAGVAAAMVGDPARVRVSPAPDLERAGLRCVRIENEIPGGPIPGSACWRPDGLLASSVRPDGFTLELVDARPEVDPARLRAPG